ncbi:MAG: 5-(carboxyamino)imidazole ribonucleotide mutase [Candidatus Bathyarchaeota archaeon]|jgi:5-(carboxyamino)imidazole ribonucleotide mutase
MKNKVVILMGSKRDLEFCREISRHLKSLKINYEFRVASAHKTPEKVLQIIKEYQESEVIYITVAGRSNALSAFVDANTTKPVIACPPYSEKFGGADLFSSLRVPSGIGLLVTIEPEGAAIAAAKILSLNQQDLALNIREHQLSHRETINKADSHLRELKE